jgi:hypothetical protein
MMKRKYAALAVVPTILLAMTAVATANENVEIFSKNAQLPQNLIALAPSAEMLDEALAELEGHAAELEDLVYAESEVALGPDGSVEVSDVAVPGALSNSSSRAPGSNALGFQSVASGIVFNGEEFFKIHGVNSIDITGDYEETGNLRDWIAKDYAIYAPLRDESGDLVSTVMLRRIRDVDELLLDEIENGAVKDEMIEYAELYGGQYKILMIGNFISPVAVEALSDPQQIAILLQYYGFQEQEGVKLVSLFQYGVVLVYIDAGDAEYAIPYAFDGLINLENGSLYEIGEMMQILAESQTS